MTAQAGRETTSRSAALAVALAMALALVLALLAPAGAAAQTCAGTLTPVAGVPSDARFAFSCDLPVVRYWLRAGSDSGEGSPPGGPHSLGQGFACVSAGGDDEYEYELDVLWTCGGGFAPAGGTIDGTFSVADDDACAVGLTLTGVAFPQSEEAEPARIQLWIDCGDGEGDRGGKGGGSEGDGGESQPVTPALSGLRVSPKAFRAARRGASVAAATGATVRYRLSAAARTTFALERALPGVLSGRRCAPPSRRVAGGRRCTRWVPLRGRFAHAGAQGANRFRFSGRLAGRRLAVGGYRLVATPRADGVTGEAVRSARFRVVR